MANLSDIITPTNIVTDTSTSTLTNKTLVAPALGTPASGTLSNTTGLPLSTGVTGNLAVANGGTGAASLTANNVVLGNGTSAVQVVAPSTSGNVLTSNGSTWASAAPAASGGKLDFVATGSLSAGDPVIIRADGTVEVVAPTSPTSVTAVGSSTLFETGRVSAVGGAYDAVNKKVLLAYKDDGNSGYQTVVAGVVAGETITFGTPLVIWSTNATAQQAFGVSFDPVNDRFLVVGPPSTNGTVGRIMQVIGTTAYQRNSVTIAPSNLPANPCVPVYDVATGKTVIYYNRYGSYNDGKAKVATISGNSISLGAEATFDSATGTVLVAVYDSASAKTVVLYKKNTGQGEAKVGTVSGTSISFGSSATFDSGAIDFLSATYDSTNNKIVAAYKDTGNSGHGTAAVGTVSGTSISFGTPVVFQAANNVSFTGTASNAGTVLICFGATYAVAGTVSGTSISFGTVVGPTGIYNSVNLLFIPANELFLASGDSGSTGVSQFLQTGTPNLTANNFVGFSSASYSNGQTAEINTVSGVDENQSGLTAGLGYYIFSSGNLNSAGTNYAGIALSATKLLVKG